MATYPMHVAGLDRDFPICKVTDDLYIGAFIMFGDAELTVRCADDADLIRGKKILLVDDVISTGGSLKAMEALVEKAGGTVTGRMAVLAEGGAADRKDILFLEKLPVFNADGSVK